MGFPIMWCNKLEFIQMAVVYYRKLYYNNEPHDTHCKHFTLVPFINQINPRIYKAKTRKIFLF